MAISTDRLATHFENLEKSGNLRVVREIRQSQGKCVLAYSQLPRVLILTQNVQKRKYLLGTVVHHMKSERRKGFSYMQVVHRVEHSCHKNVMK